MIRVFDTRTQSYHSLPDRVGIYSCGPTVYSPIHLGNARPYIVFSLFADWLRGRGKEVTWVSNLTDVNDKIDRAARDAGIPAAEWSRRMAERYRLDTDRLGLSRPDREPRVTESRAEIVGLVEDLLERGAAYRSGDDVYLSVEAVADYGGLSHQRLEDMRAADDDTVHADKRHPQDSALWKAAKPGQEMLWDSPWGPGRPGWHIECSAMAERELGVGFAVHGGGSDLLFPHHENERAQTRAARDAELAETWMHTGMIRVDGEKGSKSLGNIRPLSETLDEWGVETTLMFILGAHYRGPLSYSEDALTEAAARTRRVSELVDDLRPGPSAPGRLDAFHAALADDFNTPAALAEMFGWIRDAHRLGGDEAELAEMLGSLGLSGLSERADVPTEVVELLRERDTARASGDYAVADAARSRLAGMGWRVKDGPDGSRAEPV